MTETVITQTVRNGVDTATMFATLDAIKAQPEIAKFRSGPATSWIGRQPQPVHDQGLLRRVRRGHHPHRGLHARRGRARRSCWAATTGPNPAEYLLHALAACVTTSLVYSAAARGVNLTMVESTLEGDLNVRGAMGTNTVDFRNGFEQIRVSFRIAGDAPAEKLREVVQRGTDRSVVFDSITKGVPVSVDVDTV